MEKRICMDDDPASGNRGDCVYDQSALCRQEPLPDFEHGCPSASFRKGAGGGGARSAAPLADHGRGAEDSGPADGKGYCRTALPAEESGYAVFQHGPSGAGRFAGGTVSVPEVPFAVPADDDAGAGQQDLPGGNARNLLSADGDAADFHRRQSNFQCLLHADAGRGAAHVQGSAAAGKASALPAIDMNSILSQLDVQFSREQIETLSQAITTDFQKYMTENNLLDPTQVQTYFMNYIATNRAQTLLQQQMIQLLQESGLTDQFATLLQTQMQSIISQYTTQMSKSIQDQINAQMTKQMGTLAQNMQSAIQINPDVFAESIQMNMDEEELSELMMSLMTTETSTYENNLKLLGYANFDEPSGINIYPKDFETKQNVIDILDNYNAKMEKTDEDKVISYTDYVGTLMSSVTDIINVISYVLIAFVAISLVVSSIMIGVITYISVLERQKEIGILRAIGASKRNISQVFNAETFIVGLLAGVLGIVITLLLLIPGNMIIHSIAGNIDVSASLPVVGGVILIVLSVILTLIGGIIPSKKAAKSDPVSALRSE